MIQIFLSCLPSTPLLLLLLIHRCRSNLIHLASRTRNKVDHTKLENYEEVIKYLPGKKRIICPHVLPLIHFQGHAGVDGRVECAGEPPQVQRRYKRRAMAGVHQAHRRPACPRHKHPLVNGINGGARRDTAPVDIGPQVDVEFHPGVLAVVVAVPQLHL